MLVHYLSKVFIVLIYVVTVGAQSTTITIPLNKTTTISNKELYSDFVKLDRLSTLQVNFVNVNKNVSFIIFQVHSHLYNVTVYNNTLRRDSHVNGTNVGLYSAVQPALDTFYIYNAFNVDLTLYMSVHGYETKDPIPGGCNMEFPVPVSPFLHTTYNKDYILLDAAAAKDYHDSNCNSVNSVRVLFYKMYLPEQNFDADVYFDGIKNMMTLEKIRDNGEIIPTTATMWNMRRMLSAYRGTGSVYVAVALSGSGYSVYVPSHTYACSPLNSDCELLDDMFSQILCALLLFLGTFTCYFGHKFFKTEMFLVGLISGFIVTYILISLIAEMDLPALLGAAILSGAFFGAIWLIFWWFYGIPVFAVMLTTLNLGFLLAAVVYYRLPAGLYLLQQDFNFWTLFVSVMVLTSVSLLSVTFFSNILCCSILGAYAAVYPIDYYIGTNLKYIAINTVRRATVPLFNRAVLSPPFEWNDLLVTLMWVVLALTGFLFQHYQNRGRPPFPPPPRSISRWVPESASYGTTDDIHRRSRWRRDPVVSAPNPTHPGLYNERTPLLA